MAKMLKRVFSLFLTAALIVSTAVRMTAGASAASSKKIAYTVAHNSTKVEVTFTTASSKNTIYYTLDGSKPTSKSTKYKSKISTEKECTLRAIELNKNGKKVGSVKIQLKPKTEKEYKSEIIYTMNKARSKNLLKSLTTDDKLDKAADTRAKELSKKFSHTRPDGKKYLTAIRKAGYLYHYADELIFKGSYEEVQEEWFGKDGSKAGSLAGRWLTVSVGYYYDGKDSYWVLFLVS